MLLLSHALGWQDSGTASGSAGMSATISRPGRNVELEEWHGRVDLAASFRLAVEHGWHEAVANHFSLAVSEDGKRFLMNPRWTHFSRIRARDLLLLDADDDTTMQRPDAPDPSAWCIHGAIHAAHADARCVLHVHSAYATALACLADPTMPPIDQNTARFFNRVALDRHYGGIADNMEEGRRLASVLGGRRVLVMANHGVLVTGRTVAEAYDALYYFERACQTLVLAYSTGKPLNVMPDALAERTARGWEDYADAAAAHFGEMKRVLDTKDPSYAE
jgi:ribulose-5-phosphate 4-epimerase/fuculose-1-phosphate aldolase